jgi:hypothetical protein
MNEKHLNITFFYLEALINTLCFLFIPSPSSHPSLYINLVMESYQLICMEKLVIGLSLFGMHIWHVWDGSYTLDN